MWCLCNSNPATIMTDQAMADEIYLEPLTVETVKRIIRKERPDSILAGLGGQTGLTLAMQLDKEGFLEAQGVRLLGTDAAVISRGGGPGALQGGHGRRSASRSSPPTSRRDRGGRPGGGGKNRLPGHRPARLHPGRRRRRRGQRPRGAEDHRRHRPRRVPHHPDPGGEGHLRLEGDRVRDHAGLRGQRHRRLLHGEPGPGGRPHRRLHRGGPHPDPGGPGVPDAPQGVSGHHRPTWGSWAAATCSWH